MRLKISNFAKIEKADIKIDGITVICGDNDTGKSTIGKILFSIFNYEDFKNERIEKDLKDKIFNILRKLNIRNKFGLQFLIPRESQVIDKIFEYIQSLYNNISLEKLSEYIKNTINEDLKDIALINDNDVFLEISYDILNIISSKNYKLIFEIMSDYFGNIFENQKLRRF